MYKTIILNNNIYCFISSEKLSGLIIYALFKTIVLYTCYMIYIYVKCSEGNRKEA